jgi:hypothetical protein
MFSVITNINNNKTKGPTLIEFFTATRKLKKFFFLQLEMFDVCTTDDTTHIDTILKFLPHARQHVLLHVLATHASTLFTRVWKELEYHIDVCRVTRGAHIEHL